jgi:hypothetical protein
MKITQSWSSLNWKKLFPKNQSKNFFESGLRGSSLTNRVLKAKHESSVRKSQLLKRNNFNLLKGHYHSLKKRPKTQKYKGKKYKGEDEQMKKLKAIFQLKNGKFGKWSNWQEKNSESKLESTGRASIVSKLADTAEDQNSVKTRFKRTMDRNSWQNYKSSQKSTNKSTAVFLVVEKYKKKFGKEKSMKRGILNLDEQFDSFVRISNSKREGQLSEKDDHFLQMLNKLLQHIFVNFAKRSKLKFQNLIKSLIIRKNWKSFLKFAPQVLWNIIFSENLFLDIGKVKAPCWKNSLKKFLLGKDDYENPNCFGVK